MAPSIALIKISKVNIKQLFKWNIVLLWLVFQSFYLYFKSYITLGLEDDDLFLNFDADEIPKLDVIEFLKIHDGFPPVFQFNLRWTVYTFYWAHSSNGELTNESKLKKFDIVLY